MGTPSGSSVYASTGFACSVTCGRVSFVLGLQGPCASFDTACSSSLVAGHSSLRALQSLECPMALSSGVNMVLSAGAMRGNAIAGFTSVTGRSHTFDSRADGYARGEAIGTISSRLADGASTRLLGSAIRQDGRSASLTAPNGQAQQGVLSAALADAALTFDQVTALETHGTGTALGDPIEASAFSAVFLSRWDETKRPLAAGSLKANVGHTEPGAGLAGLLKLLAVLQNAQGAPNAQLRSINPHVRAALGGRPGALPTQLTGLGSSQRRGFAGGFFHAAIVHVHLRGKRGRGLLHSDF